MYSFSKPAPLQRAMMVVRALEKEWKNQRMNNANYERAVEMKVSDNLMSNETSVTYVTNVNCEICVSCGNDVAPAYLIARTRLILVST